MTPPPLPPFAQVRNNSEQKNRGGAEWPLLE